MKNRFLKTFAPSFAIHAIFFLLLACISFHFPHEVFPPKSIEVTVLEKKAPGVALLSMAPKKTPQKQFQKSIHLADLMPDYMKHPISALNKGAKTISAPPTEGNTAGSTSEALNTPPQVVTAFDHLAAQVDRNLDYPDLLVEHNVQGTAILNLHFDGKGKVSETESNFTGSHVAIRGLLVRATRAALMEWYRSDAYRLNSDQFKGQTFLAVFDVSYVNPDIEKIEKQSPNRYEITRRRFKSECVMPGSVDLLCVALKTEGAIENAITDASRIKFELLKDKLSQFDELGLNGINDLIQGS